jgi:1,6-anhydro-N-acetylmuramate kinase
MYLFTPRVGVTTVYLKLVLRADCIVISFHEEPGHEDQDAGQEPIPRSRVRRRPLRDVRNRDAAADGRGVSARQRGTDHGSRVSAPAVPALW